MIIWNVLDIEWLEILMAGWIVSFLISVWIFKCLMKSGFSNKHLLVMTYHPRKNFRDHRCCRHCHCLLPWRKSPELPAQRPLELVLRRWIVGNSSWIELRRRRWFGRSDRWRWTCWTGSLGSSWLWALLFGRWADWKMVREMGRPVEQWFGIGRISHRPWTASIMSQT